MSRNGKDTEKINGLIDKGCSLEGKLTFDGAVQINGDFKGEVESDGALVVGPEAHVNGKVKVSVIIVEGNVEGEVDAKLRIELRKGGRMVANIKTRTFVIEEGAIFQGNCAMLEEQVGHYETGEIAIPGEAEIASDAQDGEESMIQ